MNIYRIILPLFLSVSLMLSGTARAQEDHAVEANQEEHIDHAGQPAIGDGATHQTEKKFNAGEMILDHIKDAHDWHIADIGGHSISLPLPIILITRDQGCVAFLSSKFDHGHKQFKGFALEKGHVVRLANPDSEEGHYHSGEMPVKAASAGDYFNGDENAFIDISFTKNALAIVISVIILLLVFINVARAYVRNPNKAPKGLQSFMEPMILFVRDEVAKPSLGAKHEKYMPFLLTLFFFIWFNNMLGLVPIFPGGANVTGNIAVTMVLALFVFVIIIINANKYYWKHIFLPDVPTWLMPLMIPIEIMGMFLRPFVLMLRLFANITAGHIIVLAFISLIFIFGEMHPGAGIGVSVISLIFALFMDCLELLVAFIQAYVFTFLAALYFGMATEEHH